MKRVVIRAMVAIDGALDEVLYRPAVVKAFIWVPRWWSCDLAKLSMALDDRWNVGYWDEAWIVPGQSCEACGRRASIHVVGGQYDDLEDDGSFLSGRAVYLCGWCQLRGQIDSSADLEAALAEARQDSVSWRWRWRVRP